MKKLLLILTLSLPLFVFSQNLVEKNKTANKNVQDITWNKGSKVIQCSHFGISKPVREMKDLGSSVVSNSPPP